MATHNFKTPGITRAGFQYQDLIGISTLIKFYRDPGLYLWVQLDADEASAGALDDVLAARVDGQFELRQVKFTVDPDRFPLDWDWLLEKRPAGRSLLGKWRDSLQKAQNLGPVHSAELLTNRVPSAEFAAAIDANGFVDPAKIPAAMATTVTAELGGVANVAGFFSAFRFRHSQPTLDDLELRLKDNLVPSDTDDYGWFRLRHAVSTWATRNDAPTPDGRIKHAHLVEAISRLRPRPINQDFHVPTAYRIPSATFHEAFVKRIQRPETRVSILEGPPGRGKSTYLSYLLADMGAGGQPYVRHHYFVSLNDPAADRVSFNEIAGSMIEQMRNHYPEVVQQLQAEPQRLREWIETCGAHFKTEGKRFYVIVDGLDHVWRESRRLDQMDQLFNHFLPCPDNVSLIVGTQHVPEREFPAKLLRHAQPEDWIEIPPMDQLAVHALVSEHHAAGRLVLRKFDNDPGWEERELGQISEAFFSISHGHPLHLIYSIESAARLGRVILPDDVSRLPECPDGNIRSYYAALWTRLSAESRQILHLIAGCEFHWPETGLLSCAGPLDEIDHLLVPDRMGVTPFHGSILAWVRDLPEHEPSFKALLPKVVAWLATSAPESLRWGWLWIMKARASDPGPLLSGATRSWMIQSLAAGWPDHQIIVILSEAERVAFDRGDFPNTVRLRSMKIRLENAAKFQTNQFPLMEYCAIVGQPNKEQLELSSDLVGMLGEEQVLQLARASDVLGRPDITKKCSAELRRRVDVWLALRHQSGEKFSALADFYLESMAAVDYPNLDEALEFIRFFHEPDRRFVAFVRFLGKYGRFETLLAALQVAVADGNPAWIRIAQEQLVATGSSAGIDLSARRLPEAKEDSLLLSCVKALLKEGGGVEIALPEVPPGMIKADREYGPNRKLENFFVHTFFAALAVALNGKGRYEVPRLTGDEPEWVQSVAGRLAGLANTMASNRQALTFARCYKGAEDIPAVETDRRPDSKERTEYIAFTVALRRIAIGVHQLAHLASGPEFVGLDAMKTCRASAHWNDALWIELDLEQQLCLLHVEAALELLTSSIEQEGQTVTVFNERADKWITLSAFALLYRLPDYEICLRRAADCVVGYGWRKDMWLDQVLSAIGHMYCKAGVDPRTWIRTLAPIINEVTEFTDGDETRHFRTELIELIAEVEPEWLSPLYEYLIRQDEWGLADTVHQEMVKHADFTDPATKALAGSFVEREDIAELERRGRDGDSGAAEAAAKQAAFIGGLTTPVRADNTSKEDAADESKLPNITVYGPRDFRRMRTELDSQLPTDFKLRELAQVRWFRHWDKEGHGDELLAGAEEFFESGDNPFQVEHLLDLLFDLSFRVQGKKAAYAWLVRAQIHRRGWASYWTSSEEVFRRLDAAALHYPEKWLDFIRDTSKPGSYWEQGKYKFNIGIDRLVYFLLAAGKTELANALTQALVEVSVEELSDQPIPPTPWMPE